MRWSIPLPVLAGVALSAVVPGAVPAADGPLFPDAFLVEHRVIQAGPGDSVLATPPVVDHYGGSWIVSVRPDGGRTVLDLARREMMDVDPARGTYSVLSFDRWGELARRLRRLGSGAGASADDGPGDGPEAAPVELTVTRQAVDGPSVLDKSVLSPPSAALLADDRVERLRVTVAGDDPTAEGPTLDAWVDPRVRLSERALAALESFEAAALGPPDKTVGTSFPAMVAAARREAGGALVLRTARPATMGGDPEVVGTVEDVALRVETGISFPLELVQVPEGFERVPHVLETAVAWSEEDAELRRRMAGVSE
jgi:hypothetical protein